MLLYPFLAGYMFSGGERGWFMNIMVFLALAMFVSGQENPGKNLRAFWGVALGAVAAVLAGWLYLLL